MLSTMVFFLITSMVYSQDQSMTCNGRDLRTMAERINVIYTNGRQATALFFTEAEYQFTRDKTRLEILNVTIEQYFNLGQPDLRTLNDTLILMGSNVKRLQGNKEDIHEATRQGADDLVKTLEDTISRMTLLENSMSVLRNDIKKLISDVDKFKGLEQCQNGWIAYNRSCYLFCVESRNLNDSAEYCRDLGGHLVYVGSEAENNFLKGILRNMKDGWYWIGLTDVEKEGTWQLHGQNISSSFLDWSPNQPDNWNTGEDCAHFWEPDYQWNDFDCQSLRFFICEMEINN